MGSSPMFGVNDLCRGISSLGERHLIFIWIFFRSTRVIYCTTTTCLRQMFSVIYPTRHRRRLVKFRVFPDWQFSCCFVCSSVVAFYHFATVIRVWKCKLIARRAGGSRRELELKLFQVMIEAHQALDSSAFPVNGNKRKAIQIHSTTHSIHHV